MSDTKTVPLWKQLLGAATGAAVAVILYEVVTLAMPMLQAMVTLPSDPNLKHEGQVTLSADPGPDIRERIIRRTKEVARRMTDNPGGESRTIRTVKPVAQVVQSSASSRSSSVASSMAPVAPVMRASSSSWASSMAASSAHSIAPVVAKTTQIHGEHLPKSGLGISVLASAAFGAAVSRRKFRKA